MLQITRRSEKVWDVVDCREMFARAFEYETLGRVVLESDGLFYFERAEWQFGALAFRRVSRGYLLLSTAVKYGTSAKPNRPS